MGDRDSRVSLATEERWKMRPFARRRIVGIVGLGVLVAAVLIGVLAPIAWACTDCVESGGGCESCSLRAYAVIDQL